MNYEHKTQYYETDQMGIIHHSNYIRWFEEARIDFLSRRGFSYAEMEKAGVLIPVLGVSCQYKTMTRFGETVEIAISLEKYNGIKLELSYTVRDKETREIRCVGTSSHCFLDREGRVLNLKKSSPDYHARLASLFQEKEAGREKEG